jgi:hypothetical protein
MALFEIFSLKNPKRVGSLRRENKKKIKRKRKRKKRNKRRQEDRHEQRTRPADL